MPQWTLHATSLLPDRHDNVAVGTRGQLSIWYQEARIHGINHLEGHALRGAGIEAV